MRRAWLRLGILAVSASAVLGCRTTRSQVIATTEDVRPKQVTDPRAPASAPRPTQSLLIVSDLRLPPEVKTWDRLDLVLQEQSPLATRQNIGAYQLGTPVVLIPSNTYRVEIYAYLAETIVASTTFCAESVETRADLGTISLTLTLCLQTDDEPGSGETF